MDKLLKQESAESTYCETNHTHASAASCPVDKHSDKRVNTFMCNEAMRAWRSCLPRERSQSDRVTHLANAFAFPRNSGLLGTMKSSMFL